MTTAQAITEKIRNLPESAQREVLEFVESLAREEDTSWSHFSLASAMRGMEDEHSPYSTADLRVHFR